MTFHPSLVQWEPILLRGWIRGYLRYHDPPGWAGPGEVLFAILAFLAAIGLVLGVLQFHAWRARRR